MVDHDAELKAAILADDLQRAENALRAGANPNLHVGQRRSRSPLFTSAYAPDDYQALHLAAYDDDSELAALLLLHGANANAAIYQGVLPISIGARHNHLRVVEVLLYEYMRPKGNFAQCPLSWAAGEGHLDMLELLLAKRPEQMDVSGALYRAVSRKGNLAVIERLLAEGARADHLSPGAGEPPHTIRMQAVRFVPEAIPLFAGHDQHRLMDAAVDGDLVAATQMLDRGASPDDADIWGQSTALTGASRCGHLEIVRLLLDRGASPGGPNGRADPLMSALRGGHTDVAELLWSAGARTPRMVSSVIGYGFSMDSVRWAFDHEPCDLGFVAYTAARVKRLDVVQYALEHGASPSFDSHGRSILMLAANRHALDIVKLLIEQGANLEARDPDGFTALDYAVAINDMDDPEDPFEIDDEPFRAPVALLLQSLGLKLRDSSDG